MKSKTMRLPDDVIETIESFPGVNFTDKFIEAVRLVGRNRDLYSRELDKLDYKRQQRYQELADIQKLMYKRDSIQRSLDDISWRLSEVSRMCKAVEGVVSEWTASDTSNSK